MCAIGSMYWEKPDVCTCFFREYGKMTSVRYVDFESPERVTKSKTIFPKTNSEQIVAAR